MKGLLKFITCGSVDDGKSTLIGHILYDAKLLYADQEKALELDSKIGSRGGEIDYSLLLDGLMAEREQGITIDAAYRYFTTDHRSFIVADTPGHEEYTRNMAVGASFADLAVILVDAKQGVLVQTRRHARICSLMGIRSFVFAVNKMDLVGYDKKRFLEIEGELQDLQKELRLEQIISIPVSATEGDNVTQKSKNTPWYTGPDLLTCLEQTDVAESSEQGFVLPVQRVCRPDHTFRGFQGQIESGVIEAGEELVTLPSAQRAVVKRIFVGDRETLKAFQGQAVTIQLDREVDVSRGCVLTKGTDLKPVKQFTASLLWMDDTRLVPGKEFLVKTGTKLIPGVIKEVSYKIDVNTGEHLAAETLVKNEIARCKIVLTEPVVIDLFHRHKTLGELILIDRITNMTSACGVVEELGGTGEEGERDSTFVYGTLRARGDIFEEYYYNLESLSVMKSREVQQVYTVGDKIPLEGESYSYPEDFDVCVLRDQTAIHIRGGRVVQIQPLKEYQYSGVPVLNGRGFEIQVHSSDEMSAFLKAWELKKEESLAEFSNRWMDFGAYRRIIFHDNFWVI